MSAPDLLADLMAPFLAGEVNGVGGAANAANPAKTVDGRGFAADSPSCEELRRAANLRSPSQPFATPGPAPGSEQRRGLSQDSQDSQPSVCKRGHAVAAIGWTDGDIARFIARRNRLLRWGWRERDAEALAERLTIRDLEADDRNSCTECRHYAPGRCYNHRRAGLDLHDVGRELAGLLQRCPGFEGSDAPG